jgi:hypothetical protein
MANEQMERIGELLIEEGVITHEDIAKAVTESGAKGTAIALVLDAAKHTRRADLAAFLASDFKLPKIDDLRRLDITDDAVKAVPEELARKHELIPIAKLTGLLCVAKPNYFNRAAVQELRRVTGLKVKVFQADEGQVKAALDKHYGHKGGGALPPPRSERVDTAAYRAVPPAVKEESGRDAVPLIGGVVERPAARGGAKEEVVEILNAAKVAPNEFQEHARHPLTRLVIQWDETFVDGKPITPVKVG